ncbi:MAG: glycosyl hydrolase family [Microgenomates bacterium 39_7]|nr:MAG: glycosyl hydrolase family [Microgenomates bacterium 39_7]
MEREPNYIVFGLHAYQPLRFPFLKTLAHLNPSPDGKDWTQIIQQECYLPLLESGVFDRSTFDFYGSLRAQLNLSPEKLLELREVMAKRGVGDPFLHPILPDLNQRDKRVLIRAGRADFIRECGQKPNWFWAPESALDTSTLVEVKRAGYLGVVCAPEQLVRNDGKEVDNQPVRVVLPGGDYILAFPFDRPVSSQIGFGDKSCADQFVQNVILPRLNNLPDSNLLVTWTDAETFGHHYQYGNLFAAYLLFNSLPNNNIHPISLDMALDLSQQQAGSESLTDASLIERTAWSCSHGNLLRWNGECGCAGNNGSWKAPFVNALRKLNREVDRVMDDHLPGWEEGLTADFRRFFDGTGEPKNPQEALLWAKASSLTALTSCGLFFDNPHTSGRLNILFACQATVALEEAGLRTEAEDILNDFDSSLTDIYDLEGRPLSKVLELFRN